MDKICFVIMPIHNQEKEDDSNTYEHFLNVYNEIFVPAITQAGYIPKRADEELACNIIQIDIIQSIMDSEMVLCDLTEKNPNVLYELGIRQALDLPVVLVNEKGSPRIFDIGNIRTIDYDGNLNIISVRENIKRITEAIQRTADMEKGINSIIRYINIEKRIEEQSYSEKSDFLVLMNTLTNKIEDLEDGQEGILEFLENSQKSTEDSFSIKNKWDGFFTDYVEINEKLTSLVYEYFVEKEKIEYLKEAQRLRDIITNLPQRYSYDLSKRLVAFRYAVEKLQNAKKDNPEYNKEEFKL